MEALHPGGLGAGVREELSRIGQSGGGPTKALRSSCLPDDRATQGCDPSAESGPEWRAAERRLPFIFAQYSKDSTHTE